MAFIDLFESGEHSKNLGHFAAIVNMAAVDGALTSEETELLKRFARKLDISDDEFSQVVKNPSGYPINTQYSADKRLERMHDLFEVIFTDYVIDDEERQLIRKYAIGLGYTVELAEKLINRSIEIYSNGLDFEDYRYLLNKK